MWNFTQQVSSLRNGVFMSSGQRACSMNGMGLDAVCLHFSDGHNSLTWGSLPSWIIPQYASHGWTFSYMLGMNGLALSEPAIVTSKSSCAFIGWIITSSSPFTCWTKLIHRLILGRQLCEAIFWNLNEWIIFSCTWDHSSILEEV